MRAHKQNPTLIRITSNGQILGHLTCEQFRNMAGSKATFIHTLCEQFNHMKERRGEPERAKQVIQLANGKTI